jgi:ABC-type sulfate/molybdate transport systems ATPase subunit
MQIELTELKSKTKVTGDRSATLLKIIALLLLAAAGLVYFTPTGLSQSDRDQGRKIGFDRQR